MADKRTNSKTASKPKAKAKIEHVNTGDKAADRIANTRKGVIESVGVPHGDSETGFFGIRYPKVTIDGVTKPALLSLDNYSSNGRPSKLERAKASYAKAKVLDVVDTDIDDLLEAKDMPVTVYIGANGWFLNGFMTKLDTKADVMDRWNALKG